MNLEVITLAHTPGDIIKFSRAIHSHSKFEKSNAMQAKNP